jgi:hypothetical protein
MESTPKIEKPVENLTNQKELDPQARKELAKDVGDNARFLEHDPDPK